MSRKSEMRQYVLLYRVRSKWKVIILFSQDETLTNFTYGVNGSQRRGGSGWCWLLGGTGYQPT